MTNLPTDDALRKILYEEMPSVREAADLPEVAQIRRQQIVDATIALIEEQGLHQVSLSKIEKRAKMRRGQLTYYFPTKEAILLAVFDELLIRMFLRIEKTFGSSARCMTEAIGDSLYKMFSILLSSNRMGKEFDSLQYTFLAQVAHRPDYRSRLATQYAHWREKMAEHWRRTVAEDVPAFAQSFQAKTITSFIQALVHGLNVQLLADPDAFDCSEMLRLVMGVLQPLGIAPPKAIQTLPQAGES